MEKIKPQSPKKRQRKMSLTPSDPKFAKLETADPHIRPLSLPPSILKSKKPKLKNKEKAKLGELPAQIKPAKVNMLALSNIIPKNKDTKPPIEGSKKKTPKLIVNIANKKEKNTSPDALLQKKNKKQPIFEENLKKEFDSKDDEPSAEKVKEKPNKAQLAKEVNEKYPILMNMSLISRFLKVPMSNNQKGRLRQGIRQSLQGSSNIIFPEIINGKIQAILKSSPDLTDSELRRIRVLYNMLKTALDSDIFDESNMKSFNENVDNERKKNEDKRKGPKRYVVFLGNLPLDITKEMIMNHFRELNEHIKDIRLPKLAEGTKSAIAYVELSNEPSFELALSKHHSMLGNKRIKVLYTTQQKSKISRTDAKSKSAKLIALQKSGKLVGSTPLNKKRSHRRKIMKEAQAKEAAACA